MDQVSKKLIKSAIPYKYNEIIDQPTSSGEYYFGVETTK
jgi:hypothetical protein